MEEKKISVGYYNQLLLSQKKEGQCENQWVIAIWTTTSIHKSRTIEGRTLRIAW